MSGTPTLGDGSWAAMRRAVRLGDSARRSVLTRIVPEAVTVIKSEKSVSLPLSYAFSDPCTFRRARGFSARTLSACRPLGTSRLPEGSPLYLYERSQYSKKFDGMIHTHVGP